MASITAVIVNYNSGEDCARLLTQLDEQTDVILSAVVIDSASIDGSLARAKRAAVDLHMPVRFVEPGRNVGYTGNNLALNETAHNVFIVNPDVRLTSRDTLAVLARVLNESDDIAAVAPCILVDGRIEYVGSVLDLDSAHAFHSPTHVEAWPYAEASHELPWLNGAAWLLRADAVAVVGTFDERYFLFFEEVDWCIRARQKGWRLLLTNATTVGHVRSSSFSGTKGTYYYWRNLHLLCSEYARGWWGAYVRRFLSDNARRSVLRSGAAGRALVGWRDARAGRFGPAAEDRPGS